MYGDFYLRFRVISTCVKVSPSFLFPQKKRRNDARLDFLPIFYRFSPSLLGFIVPAYAIVIMSGSIKRGIASTFGHTVFSIYIVPFASAPLRSPCANRSFNHFYRKRRRPFRFSILKHGIFFVLRSPCPRGVPSLRCGSFLQHRLNSLTID